VPIADVDEAPSRTYRLEQRSGSGRIAHRGGGIAKIRSCSTFDDGEFSSARIRERAFECRTCVVFFAAAIQHEQFNDICN